MNVKEYLEKKTAFKMRVKLDTPNTLWISERVQEEKVMRVDPDVVWRSSEFL